MHVHGLINHELQQRQLYGSLEHWSHGADYICTILHSHLSTLKDSIEPSKWPHTLFLQVDNCWRENKNTTVIRYLGILIKFGWFKHIYMHSLPTGRTHEDIDQMFSTWNVHYWRIGLASPLVVPEFVEWAYQNESKRPHFQMVHHCYKFKDWLQNFGVTMKEHTEFRSFKMDLEKVSVNSNITLLYKSSSLDVDWNGLSSEDKNGIIVFHSFPNVEQSPNLYDPQELDLDLINNLLNNSSITNNLDPESHEFYLQLQTNSFFYFSSTSSQQLFHLGPYHVLDNPPITYAPNVNNFITTDFIQQHLLRYSVVESDINSNIVVNLHCGNFPFYLAKVVEIKEDLVVCNPFVQHGTFTFDNKWFQLCYAPQTISKDKIIAKGVTFTQNMTLKKKWKIYLKNTYNL